MKKHKIVFDKVNARVVTEDDSINVFYTSDVEKPDNDCPDDVVEVVVQMHNEGKTLMEIDEYLLDADCTQDAREVMVEGLFPIHNPMFEVILGNITFLDLTIDGEHKAIVHSISEREKFVTSEDAEKYGEDGLDRCEGYLIPQLYTGVIVYETQDI